MDGVTPNAGNRDQVEAAGTAAPAASTPAHGPTLDEALRDPALRAEHVAPYASEIVDELTRISLPKPVLRELRFQLFLSSSLPRELELVQHRYATGDVVIRLANPAKPERGETILGCYSAREGKGL